MDSAVYSATTGMMSRSRALDVTANNIANMNTPGYRRQQLATSTFGDHVLYRVAAGRQVQIGNANHGSTIETVFAVSTPGSVTATGRSLDLAITGNGYFAVEGADGGQRLTRGGNFTVSNDGYLVTGAGDYALAQDGQRIQIGSGESLSVSSGGTIRTAQGNVSTLQIVAPDEGAQLQPEANGTYLYNGPAGVFTGSVRQGMLESTNVSMIDEMVSMIEASRSFQSCGQIVKMLDAVNQRMTGELGRV